MNIKKKIVLDLETTGLNPLKGDKIVEIACIEIIDRKITKNKFHYYINPECKSSKEAFNIHGLKEDFLKNKPKFSEIIEKFCLFISNSEIIIHNAPFDISFLNNEFKNLGLIFDNYFIKITDTLKLAREKFPGKYNSLDALCNRYNIHNNRKLHGALIDAEILSKIYLLMTIDQKKIFKKKKYKYKKNILLKKNKLLVNYANYKDIKLHNYMLKFMHKTTKKLPIWLYN